MSVDSVVDETVGEGSINDTVFKYTPEVGSENMSMSEELSPGCPALSAGYKSNFDDAVCLPGDMIYNVQTKWHEDPGFYPTSITYGIAFIVGVAGNALVVFALLGDKKARNATSSFLVSLAFADLLFLLTCVPYETAAKLSTFWEGGRALCKLSGYVEMMTASASILNLTAVSVERYVVIVHPMKTRSWFTLGNTLKLILCVWAIALLLSAPVIYTMDTTTNLFYNNETQLIHQICRDINYGNDMERIIFAWYQMIMMFLLPVIVMGYCYAVVIRVLWLSTKELAKMTSSRSDSEDESKQRLTGMTSAPGQGRGVIRQAVNDHSAEVREARKQVIKMLLTIIGIFLFCWGPKLILNILKKHSLNALLTDRAFEVTLAINLLPYVQSATNPLIYGFMSNNFRRSLRMAFLSRCRCDPMTLCIRKPRSTEYDMDTKSVTIGNGTYSSKFSPSTTRAAAVPGRTSMTVVSDI